jgi:hypothetical protein
LFAKISKVPGASLENAGAEPRVHYQKPGGLLSKPLSFNFISNYFLKNKPVDRVYGTVDRVHGAGARRRKPGGRLPWPSCAGEEGKTRRGRRGFRLGAHRPEGQPERAGGGNGGRRTSGGGAGSRNATRWSFVWPGCFTGALFVSAWTRKRRRRAR